MSQKLAVNNLVWIEETSKFNENFIKHYNEESDISPKLMFNIVKNCKNPVMIYHFYLKE